MFLNTCQKMINGVGWLDDRHGLSPILYDTEPLFVYTDQLLWHCVFICSNVRWWLAYCMRWLLWCFCLLAESYETINHWPLTLRQMTYVLLYMSLFRLQFAQQWGIPMKMQLQKVCCVIFVKPQQWPTPSESIAIYCVRKLVSLRFAVYLTLSNCRRSFKFELLHCIWSDLNATSWLTSLYFVWSKPTPQVKCTFMKT